ncbi:hypothetical protein ABIF34_003995 [Bradyrhizobium japonicum]
MSFPVSQWMVMPDASASPAFALNRFAVARVQGGEEVVEARKTLVVPVELLVGTLEEAVPGEQLPLRLPREGDVHRGSLADPAQRHQPARQCLHDALAVDTVADQQPRPGRRGEGNRDLELGIVAPAGPLVGVSPAAVEDVFALRMRFQIAGHDADNAAVDLGDQMPGSPSGADRGRTRFLDGGEKRVRDERVIGRL